MVNKAALAVIFPSESYCQKLPHDTSMYTAELTAIRAALQYIRKYYLYRLSLSLLYNPLNPKEYTDQ